MTRFLIAGPALLLFAMTIALDAEVALAAAPDFVISDTADGGDCTAAPFNGVWDNSTSTCTIYNRVHLRSQSLTVDVGVTVAMQGGVGAQSAQLGLLDAVLTNSGVMTFNGGDGGASGSLVNGGTIPGDPPTLLFGSITNAGLMTFNGGGGEISGELANNVGELENECGATINMIGGTGDRSARIFNVATITNSGTITLTPGTGAGSGVLVGPIEEGPPCAQPPSFEFAKIADD